MGTRALLYFTLGVLTTVGLGQTVNQLVRDREAPSTADEPTPQSHAGTGGGIVVDGVEVETKADPPCYPSTGSAQRDDRYINCFNGTVLDTVTGLLWLRNANCLFRGLPFPDSGERNWWDASAFAAGLASGQCGLTDHSQPGDWRLPTRAEWEVTIDEAVDLGCRTVGPGAPPSLTNNPGLDCLAVGPTYFLNVGGRYWSSMSRDVSPTSVWVTSLDLGTALGGLPKENSRLTWPVRGGQ